MSEDFSSPSAEQTGTRPNNETTYQNSVDTERDEKGVGSTPKASDSPSTPLTPEPATTELENAPPVSKFGLLIMALSALSMAMSFVFMLLATGLFMPVDLPDSYLMVGGSINALFIPLGYSLYALKSIFSSEENSSTKVLNAVPNLLLLLLTVVVSLSAYHLFINPFNVAEGVTILAKIGVFVGSISPLLVGVYTLKYKLFPAEEEKASLLPSFSATTAIFIISEILTLGFTLLIAGSFIPQMGDFSIKPMLTMPVIIAGIANMALLSIYTFFSKKEAGTSWAVKGLTLFGLTVISLSAVVLLNPQPSSEALFLVSKVGMLLGSTLLYGLGIVTHFSKDRSDAASARELRNVVTDGAISEESSPPSPSTSNTTGMNQPLLGSSSQNNAQNGGNLYQTFGTTRGMSGELTDDSDDHYSIADGNFGENFLDPPTRSCWDWATSFFGGSSTSDHSSAATLVPPQEESALTQ